MEFLCWQLLCTKSEISNVHKSILIINPKYAKHNQCSYCLHEKNHNNHIEHDSSHCHWLNIHNSIFQKNLFQTGSKCQENRDNYHKATTLWFTYVDILYRYTTRQLDGKRKQPYIKHKIVFVLAFIDGLQTNPFVQNAKPFCTNAFTPRERREKERVKYTKSVTKISLSLLCQWHFNKFASDAL